MTRNEKQDVNRRVKRHSLFLHTDWPVKLLLVLSTLPVRFWFGTARMPLEQLARMIWFRLS